MENWTSIVKGRYLRSSKRQDLQLDLWLSFTRRSILLAAFFIKLWMWSFHASVLLMIRPSSLLEVVVWICVPSTVTGSKCCRGRRNMKLIVSSLVFSRFNWNKFSADQLETWSTASCALLCCPFGTFSDYWWIKLQPYYFVIVAAL